MSGSWPIWAGRAVEPIGSSLIRLHRYWTLIPHVADGSTHAVPLEILGRLTKVQHQLFGCSLEMPAATYSTSRSGDSITCRRPGRRRR